MVMMMMLMGDNACHDVMELLLTSAPSLPPIVLSSEVPSGFLDRSTTLGPSFDDDDDDDA
jgi:hypothetical protein